MMFFAAAERAFAMTSTPPIVGISQCLRFFAHAAIVLREAGRRGIEYGLSPYQRF